MSDDPSNQPSTDDAVEPLRARLSADLRTAMKKRDTAAVDTLRCLLAVLDNAGAQHPGTFPSQVFGRSAEVPRKSLTQIEYERAGRHQDAARLRAELRLLSRYIALDHLPS